MITRKLGKLLRGKATPFQIVAACILGGALGFAPGLLQAPALYLLLFAVLLVVNANLGLALLVAAGARLLSFVAAPVSFQVGRFLLDGPTAGLAEVLVNAPVLAWCGFEYYAVAGGQLLGLAVGALCGLLVSRSVSGFRRKMAAAQENPGRMQELAARPWARFMIWLLFGKAAKGSWDEKLGKRVGNPVRIWGAALIVVLLAGAWIAQAKLADPLARRGLRAGLEAANGATVDVGAVELELGEGRVAVAALALADPNALSQDVFRADLLEADVDQADFLRKRFHVRKLVVSEARSGAPREVPGERLAPPAPEPEEDAESSAPDLEDLSLEDVIQEYEVWKERLAQGRRWLDRLSGDSGGGEEEAGGETLAERLEREAREGGWFSVQAGHLIDEAPTFRLSELVVEGLQASWLDGKTLDVKGLELSTHPRLVDAPPRVEVASRDGVFGLVVDLAPVSRGGGDGALQFHWTGLDVDTVMAKLKLPGGAPFRGGTLDVAIDGAWDRGRIGYVDLPLVVTLRGTTFQTQGIDPTPIEQLELPIGISGRIDAPRIRFDASRLTDALVEAGKQELVNKLEGQAREHLDGALEDLTKDSGIELPGAEDAKGALQGLFGGKGGS